MTRHFLPKLLLVLVLLYVQYGSLVHSVEHLFYPHDQTISCTAFLAAKQLTDAYLTSFLPVSHFNRIALFEPVQTQSQTFVKRAKRPPRARSPPFIYA